MKQKTFNTYTFGCRVNEAETMTIENKLKDSGWKKDMIYP